MAEAAEGQGIQTKPISRDTGIAPEYGEKTWRPVQSVIDIVQNHLDANTTVYEKRLLRTLGITEYKPADEQQQRAVSSLNLLKYAKTPEEIAKAQSGLQGLLNDGTPDIQAIKGELEGVEYQLPDLKLKVSNGSTSHYVSYEQVKDLNKKWQITGFLIDDQGSGFDNQLLGIMGGSTKSDSTGKRGGLGEGLKMSVTHLLRAGATMHLVSRNGDQLWTADPSVENGTVNFHGLAITGEQSDTQGQTHSQKKGSTTEIDFSSHRFDRKLREELIDALDPRKGEGLGKYILDFRGKEFSPVIHNGSTELASYGVPDGRVYVRGLLVQDSTNALWSYNLGDKWAITGRDRKTIDPSKLENTIRSVIQELDDPEKIKIIVGLVTKTNHLLESKVLNNNLSIDEEKRTQWQRAITEVFQFSSGETLFAPSNTSTTGERFAKERGFHIIRIPVEHSGAISLFKRLFPGETIALDQIYQEQSKYEAHIPYSSPRWRYAAPEPVPEDHLDPNTEMIVQSYKNTFLELFTPYARKNGLPIGTLMHVQFAQPPSNKSWLFGSKNNHFAYDSKKNIIYVRGSLEKQDFATLTDLSVQLVKTITRQDDFDAESQQIITGLAGEAIAGLHPDLLSGLTITPQKSRLELDRPSSYSPKQRETDTKLIEMYTLYERINTPNISLDDLQQTLNQLKTTGYRIDYSYLFNPFFYFNGKIYRFDRDNQQLIEQETQQYGQTKQKISARARITEYVRKRLKIDDEIKSRPPMLLNPESTEHHLQSNRSFYLPYSLEDGESMRLISSDGQNEEVIFIKRLGNNIIAKRKKADGTQTIIRPNRSEQYSGDFMVWNNVMIFNPQSDINIRVDQSTNASSTELAEVNTGQHFLEANITLDYGGEVWRDPKRILLDALQNHIDAKNDTLPEITYTVVNPSGQIEQVTQAMLETRDQSWKIIGMTISDTGQGYPTPYLTILGKSTKGDEDIGKFGEGLKMLSAAALRQGISISLNSRQWQAYPAPYMQTITDYETDTQKSFEMLGYNLRWQEQSRTGSETSFSFLPLSSEITHLTTSQQAEVNDFTSEKNKIWQAWIDVLDPRKADVYGRRGLARYVVPKSDRQYTDGIITLLPDRPGSIYEKGLLIPGGNKRCIFGYNIDETIIDTRERNTFNESLLEKYLQEYFRNLTDKTVMKKILETAKQHPDIDYYEYKFFYYIRSLQATTLWKQAFYEVFGDNAILSVRPLYESYQNPRAEWEKEYQQRYARGIAVEEHLENTNLQQLQLSLTHFFYNNNIYSSLTFRQELEAANIELLETDKDKVVQFVQATNQSLLSLLESLDLNPEIKAYLETIVPHSILEERMTELSGITADDLHIKHALFPAHGMVERISKRPKVSLNQSILNDAGQTAEVYVHEAAHYLSAQGDYILQFQRFLMALVMARLTTRNN